MGLEMGISKIHLTIEGLGHPLFRGINPANFEVYSSHSDAVTLVGKEVVNLAWNEMTQVQATSYHNHIYTVQFHPEFNRNIMRHYIEANRQNLEKYHLRNPSQVLSPAVLLKRNKQLMKIHLVLENFIKIASGLSSAK